MQSGLFKRSEYNIPHNKIQYFKWSSNPLRRFIGYQTMRIKQAGSQEVGARKTVSIPGLKKRDLVKVLQTFYPQRHQGRSSTFKADFLLAQQYFFWMGILPALAVATLFYFQNFIWLFYLPLAVFLVVVAWLIYRYAQTVQLRVNEAVVELKKGWLFPSQVSIKHYKLQNISYKQSVFQKRKNLASLVLYTAAGAEAMPHIPALQAKALYNYLLFKIESSDKGWM
jgi:putative membrane protein